MLTDNVWTTESSEYVLEISGNTRLIGSLDVSGITTFEKKVDFLENIDLEKGKYIKIKNSAGTEHFDLNYDFLKRLQETVGTGISQEHTHVHTSDDHAHDDTSLAAPIGHDHSDANLLWDKHSDGSGYLTKKIGIGGINTFNEQLYIVGDTKTTGQFTSNTLEVSSTSELSNVNITGITNISGNTNIIGNTDIKD